MAANWHLIIWTWIIVTMIVCTISIGYKIIKYSEKTKVSSVYKTIANSTVFVVRYIAGGIFLGMLILGLLKLISLFK